MVSEGRLGKFTFILMSARTTMPASRLKPIIKSQNIMHLTIRNFTEMKTEEVLPWRETFKIRTYDVDFNNAVKLSSIFNFMQESASNNAEQLKFGYDDLNKPLFLAIANGLRDQGYTVFNPAEVNDDDMDFEDCMRIDLDAIVNKCDGIVFLPKWKLSEGSNAEALAACVCGKDAYTAQLLKKKNVVRLKPFNLKRYFLPYGGASSQSLSPRTKRKNV